MNNNESPAVSSDMPTPSDKLPGGLIRNFWLDLSRDRPSIETLQAIEQRIKAAAGGKP